MKAPFWNEIARKYLKTFEKIASLKTSKKSLG